VTPKACEEYRRRLDRADPGALRAPAVPPGFVTAVVTVAIATCVPVAIPVIARYFAAGARGLPLPSVQELAPVAVAWFTFAAILAADLTRRLRPA